MPGIQACDSPSYTPLLPIFDLHLEYIIRKEPPIARTATVVLRLGIRHASLAHRMLPTPTRPAIPQQFERVRYQVCVPHVRRGCVDSHDILCEASSRGLAPVWRQTSVRARGVEHENEPQGARARRGGRRVHDPVKILG